MRERQWCGFLRGLVKPASSAGVSFDFSQDALEIEALAKCRLADAYDAAQERGEVSSQRRHPSHVPDENMRAASADLGITDSLAPQQPEWQLAAETPTTSLLLGLHLPEGQLSCAVMSGC